MSTTVKAAIWMIGAILSFSLMAVAGRFVSVTHDTFEIMFYRSLVGIVIMATVVVGQGRWADLTWHRWPLHLIRNVAHFTGQNLWFFAITVVPLAQVIAVEFTMPIWAILLSVVILGERLTRVGAMAAVVGFVGVMIVARPDFSALSPGIIAAAASAIAFAFTAIFTRMLTRTETTVTILIYLTVMQAVFGLICAGYDGQITAPTASSWPWLVAIGCSGLMAHFCLTTALSMAPANIVIPIDFARLPLVAVLGMVIFQEPLDPWVFVGAALIFGANYANILSETRKKPI
ncbi:MAG: DMT family transporter [Pseudomonadota bacterium]